MLNEVKSRFLSGKRILIIPIIFAVGLGLCFSKEKLKVYTVVKGDTLSGIAQNFYNDRTQWKKICAHNKYIKNAHWIFPGDTLVIPVDVADEVEEKVTEEPEQEEPAAAAITATEIKKTDEVEEDTIIADENWIYDGYISGEKGTKSYIGQGDVVFLDLGKGHNVKSLDRFTVFRKDRTMYHPKTQKMLGILMRKIGVVEVTTDIQEELCTGKIINSREPIVLGDIIKKQPKVKVKNESPDANTEK